MLAQCGWDLKRSLKEHPFRENIRFNGVTWSSLIDTSRDDFGITGTEPCSPRVKTVNKYDSQEGDVYCFCCRTFLWNVNDSNQSLTFKAMLPPLLPVPLVQSFWNSMKFIEYQGVKNFTLVARMQKSSSILRATDESSMFWRCAVQAMSKTSQNMLERSNSLLSPTYWLVPWGNNW